MPENQPLPPLTPGRNYQTVLKNSLRLVRLGVPREQALALALNFAGYRPRNLEDFLDQTRSLPESQPLRPLPGSPPKWFEN